MIPAIFGELLAIVFVAGTSHLAVVTGVGYLLFPEMGALAYDTCKRPFGIWACAPVSLFVAPTVAAANGTAICWGLPSSLAATALCITLAIGLLRLARSPIAPAISAAYLPLALNVRTWHYPVAIAIVTGALACIVFARRCFLKIDSGQPKAGRR